jgi:hypothetical protein
MEGRTPHSPTALLLDYLSQIAQMRMTCDANPHTPPELQIEFSVTLAEIRRPYLVEALADTVRTIKIAELDKGMVGLCWRMRSRKWLATACAQKLIFPVRIPFVSPQGTSGVQHPATLSLKLPRGQGGCR